MIMDHWQKYTDRETKVLGAQNIAVLLFKPKILDGPPGIGPGPPRRESIYLLPELWHSSEVGIIFLLHLYLCINLVIFYVLSYCCNFILFCLLIFHFIIFQQLSWVRI